MKPFSKPETIIATNLTSGKAFGMKPNASAFKIFSDKIYENKIRAVVREIGCNAYDSHVMAGIPDMPFKVHLPNQLEPFFSVQDFGVGLSLQEVEDIFTVYFESTKADTNNLIGAMGLGSKSPFAYTDQFTVISVYGGMETTYLCFMNATGFPELATIGSVPTDAGNGVTVKVEVSEHDFHSFGREAQTVYQWFDLPPTMNLNQVDSVVDDNPDYQLTGQSRTLVAFQSRTLVALMGNVAYPINYRDFIASDNTLNDILGPNGGLVLKFAIGDLDVSASRESLSLDPETVSRVKRKVELVAETIIINMQAAVDDCETISDVSKLNDVIIRNYELFTYQGVPLSLWYANMNGLDGIPEMVRVRVPYGRKNFRASRHFGDRLHPFKTGGENIIFIEKDQSAHSRHVINSLCERSMYTYVSEDVAEIDAAIAYMEECGFVCERFKVSAEVAAGNRPPKAVRGGGGGGGVNVTVYHKGANGVDSSSTRKMSRTEIKAALIDFESKGYTTYAMTEHWAMNHYIKGAMDTMQVIFETSQKTVEWLQDKFGCRDMEELKFLPAIIDMFRQGIAMEQVLEINGTHLYSVVFQNLTMFDELFGVDADVVKQHQAYVDSLANGIEYALGHFKSYVAYFTELRQLKEEGIVRVPAIDFDEWSANYITDLQQKFPLLSFRNMVDQFTDAAFALDAKNYIQMKKAA